MADVTVVEVQVGAHVVELAFAVQWVFVCVDHEQNFMFVASKGGYPMSDVTNECFSRVWGVGFVVLLVGIEKMPLLGEGSFWTALFNGVCVDLVCADDCQVGVSSTLQGDFCPSAETAGVLVIVSDAGHPVA